MPCRNCVPPNRGEGCHDTCLDYLELKKKLAIINEQRIIETDLRNYQYRAKRRTIKRGRDK